MELQKFVLGDIRSNCYILYQNGHAIVIDPGFPSDEVIAFIKDNHLSIDGIFITHGHYDHIGGVNQLKKKFHPTVYAPKADHMFLTKGDYNRWGEDISVDVWIENEMTLHFIGVDADVIMTPGHSPGGLVLRFDDILFSGDTLFYQSVGRTDLPYSNAMDIYHSIQKLYRLCHDDMIVYPGHGRATTIGHEKTYNPFVRKK